MNNALESIGEGVDPVAVLKQMVFKVTTQVASSTIMGYKQRMDRIVRQAEEERNHLLKLLTGKKKLQREVQPAVGGLW